MTDYKKLLCKDITPAVFIIIIAMSACVVWLALDADVREFIGGLWL